MIGRLVEYDSGAEAELSDNQLIERTLAGETDTFNLLVRRWERQIYSLALRMTGREEEARDVCQETFLAAYRSLGSFRGEAKFSSWIYRIALNACHSRLRRQGTASELSLDETDDEGRRIEIADVSAEQAADRLHRDERVAIVRRALHALPTEMRQVIVMKEYEELTFAEIAEVLGLPVSTVKSRLYTGLQLMRAKLAHLREAI
ncbi:MAG TPA: sigma-70 family RNA polymerase sigma factor [Blastocatellia bacterium]|nr:sigma-70 family RNA polymerase sigma factor [Blastocatellia bacterium]